MPINKPEGGGGRLGGLGNYEGGAVRGRTVPNAKIVTTRPPTDLAKAKYRAFGGGSVPEGTREVIRHQMDRGLKPDIQRNEAVIGKSEPVRPPKAPAVRVHISQERPKPAPRPSIPAPKVSVKPRTAPTIKPSTQTLQQQRQLGERAKLGPHGTDPRSIKEDRATARQKLGELRQIRNMQNKGE